MKYLAVHQAPYCIFKTRFFVDILSYCEMGNTDQLLLTSKRRGIFLLKALYDRSQLRTHELVHNTEFIGNTEGIAPKYRRNYLT